MLYMWFHQAAKHAQKTSVHPLLHTQAQQHFFPSITITCNYLPSSYSMGTYKIFLFYLFLFILCHFDTPLVFRYPISLLPRNVFIFKVFTLFMRNIESTRHVTKRRQVVLSIRVNYLDLNVLLYRSFCFWLNTGKILRRRNHNYMTY